LGRFRWRIDPALSSPFPAGLASGSLVGFGAADCRFPAGRVGAARSA
jgi:hypothetical protein